jgi:hypothetical protein
LADGWVGIQVKGKRLDVETGIRTRSKAKQQEERWEYVPAPVKIFSLLADTLVEAKEGETPPLTIPSIDVTSLSQG